MDKLKRITSYIQYRFQELDRKYQAIIGIAIIVVLIFLVT